MGSDHRNEQRRLAQLETSLQINRQIGALLDRQQLSSEITGLIRHHYGYDQAMIARCDAAERVFLPDTPEDGAGVCVLIPLAEAGLLKVGIGRSASASATVE